MTQSRRADVKHRTLREQGTLNPTPEKVQDPLFLDGEFFDPRDLPQVKYEMLRSVRSQKNSVAEAATRFGLSRPSYYKARSDFEHGGLSGLLPNKRGPRGPHKLTTNVLDFIQRLRAKDQALDLLELAQRIEKHFGHSVHPRTIERALNRPEKKR